LEHPPLASADSQKGSDNFRTIILFFLGILLVSIISFFIFEESITQNLISHLPKDNGKTQEYYKDLFRLGVFELIWIFVLLLLVFLLYSSSRLQIKISKVEEKIILNYRYFVFGFISFFAVIVLVISLIALKSFPNSSDEYVYLFQSETLSEGRLWDPSHPVEKSFGFNHVGSKDGVTIGRFPPGWPLIIALFRLAGIPVALVNPILAIITLVVFFFFAKRHYGLRVALWCLALLGTSSFYLFNSASFFSHTSCLLEVLLFVHFTYLYLEKRKVRHGLLAGFALGLIMLIRYYTAVLLFLPFSILLFYREGLKAFRFFVWLGLGALPFLIVFLWYNGSITGNMLEPVTVWAFKNEALGFVNGHTVLKGIEHISRRFLMFCYWASPVFLLLYFHFIWRKLKNPVSRMIMVEDYLFVTFIIGYFFYYEIGGNQYGPRFYFEAFPFLLLFIVYKVFKENNYGATIFIYASLFTMVLRMPFIAHREHKIVEERMDVYSLVRKNHVKNSIVLLSSGTGVIRPMPAGDLTRNDHTLTNDVLFAIDDRRYNAALLNFFPNKNVFLYQREPGHVQGKLIRIR
jgi:hypothetical protein